MGVHRPRTTVASTSAYVHVEGQEETDVKRKPDLTPTYLSPPTESAFCLMLVYYISTYVISRYVISRSRLPILVLGRPEEGEQGELQLCSIGYYPFIAPVSLNRHH